MAYVQMFAPCIRCQRVFSFNPMKVPSVRPSPDAPREPLCEGCFNVLNAVRQQRGLEPIAALPGAWEPCDENEVVW